MKKHLNSLVLFLLFGALGVQAQVSISGGTTAAGSYTTLSAAITALNGGGVLTAPVTVDVAAGHTETLTGIITLTATGDVTNTITIQKNGSGVNPVLTSYVGTATATSATMDGMFALQGSDYVTIDGIDLQESAANTTNTTTMEYGYGLFKASATDGANNNTIKNCVITLNRLNFTAPTSGPAFQGSNGICLLACTPTTMQTNLTVTAISGASSNNKFYTNTIQNVNCGIGMTGFAGASPYTLCDTGNDVGGSSAATGNTIINFGGGTGATVACAAVFVKDQWSVNISYNTVDNNVGGTGGANHPNTNRGIFTNGSSIGASATINNNNVTIRGGTSSTAIDWAIDCEMAQSGANGNTISINNNTVSIEKTTSTAVALTAIWANSAPTTLNINNNIITKFVSTGTATADVGPIRVALAPATLNINNNNISGVVFNGTTGTNFVISSTSAVTTAANINDNIINGVSLPTATTKTLNVITRTAATNTASVSINNNSFENITRVGSGTVTFITGTGTPLNQTINNNQFKNLTINTTGAVTFISQTYSGIATATKAVNGNTIVTQFSKTGAGGTVTLITDNGSTVAGAVSNCQNNDFSNITVTGATGITGINYTDGGTAPTRTVSGNILNNWTGGSSAINAMNFTYWNGISTLTNNTITNITSQSAITGITIGSTANNATNATISSNIINNLTSNGTGGNVIGITCANTSPLVNINNNTIHTLSSTGTTVTGINVTGATLTNVFRNKIYNLSSTNTNPTVSGIANGGGSTVNIHTNIIGDLRTPAANAANPLIGLNVTGGTNVNAFYNTVYLNGVSSGALFGSSAISASTTPNLTLRNNIFVNNSTSNGAGLTVAYRRSGTTLTSYNSASNNNVFYGASIYTDGTNTDASMAAYKARVSARDANSFLELPTFLNTATGSGADFLHINTTVGTQIESGGVAISGIDTDFDGDIRQGSAGYAGAGVGTDIGADEGDFALTDLTAPTITSVALVGNACGSSSRDVTASIIDASGVPTTGVLMPRIYFRKNAGAYSSAAGVLTSGTAKTGNWTFTINYATLGGISLGDFVEYYIIAQDIAAVTNLSSNPLGAVATDVNTITTAPTAFNYSQASFLSGTYTVGTGGNFTTLTDAANAYNTSCLNAPVVFQLTDVVYNESITLMNNVDASATNTLTIYPVNAATVISGNTASPTIDLSGARYINIDGRVGGTGGFASGSSLVINNTLGTASAIRFINEASNNTVKYCDVQSNNSNTAAATAGVILFSTTTGANGNDNNIIDYCDVHNISGGNPTVAINANGTTTTAATNNDNNVISNSNIYNYFNAASAYSGILVNGGNSAWSILNNRFYQTTPLTVTGTGFNKDVYLNNLTGNATGSGFNVSNNYFGGDNNGGSGLYSITGTTAHQYCAIYCAVGVGTPTSVQNNTITNISFTSGSTSAAAMSAITSNGGNVNIGTVTGNLIGIANTDASVSPAITYTNNSTTTGGFIPIFAQTANNSALSTTNISNNTIAGISISANNANNAAAVDFNAIGYNNGEVTITNNTIGSLTTPKSIFCSGAGTASNTNTSRFAGILVSGGAISSKNVTISGNTIANMYTNHSSPGAPGTTGTRGVLVLGTLTGNIATVISNNTIRDLTTFSQATSGAAVGIAVQATSIGTCDVVDNKIYNINLAGAAVTGSVQAAGLFINSSPTGAATIARNNIHSFGLTADNPSAFLTGMDIAGGNWTIANNMVRLGIDGSGNDVTAACTVRGITKNVATSRIYHNSVYIGGSNVGTAATSTFALVRTGTAVDDWRNNILVNNRSNATTGGKHYAINLNATTTLTLDYNDYFGNGTGFVFGSTASTGADVPFYSSNWITGDINSYSFDPLFINATGNSSTGNLHIDPVNATIIEGTGTPIATVTTDFDNETRSGLTPTDIGADAGNFTSLVCNGTPSATTAVISGATTPICISGTKTLALSGYSAVPGLSLQWKESASQGGPYTNVTGGVGATSSAYTTATLTAPKYFICEVTCATSSASTASSEVMVDINNPTVNSTSNGTQCGTGAVTLNGTASAGAELQWYSALTGGTPVGMGTTFTTPVLSTSTDYYVSAFVASNNVNIAQGAGATTSATYSNPFYSAWSNNHTQHLITASELSASGLVAGNINSVALDVTNAGTLPMIDLTVKIGTTTATSMSSFVNSTAFATVYNSPSLLPTLGLNVLTFSSPFNWDGTSNIILEFCHGNGASTATMSRTVKADNTSYVSSIKAQVSAATAATAICSDVSTNLLTYTVRPQFIFNARGKTCESTPRQLVSATITQAPAFTITGNQLLCTNQAGPISVLTGAADYDSYTWSPSTGLYLDAALTQPYNGATTSATTLYLNSATAGSVPYTCNALKTTTGCVNTASSIVTFGLFGTATVASQPNECPGVGLVAVNVSGAGTIVNEDFTSGILPSNMTSAGNDFAITGGRMQFTSAQNSKNGGVLITNPTGVANNDFQIDFDMITTSGGGSPADGFSYSYGPDVVALPTGTAATGTSGVTTLAPENGSGTKLKLSFDAINNTGGCTNGLPASNGNGNTSGIYLMYNETTSHQGPTCPGVLYYSNNVSWRATATTGASTHVTIKINSAGQVSMWLNGIQVVTDQQLPAAYLTDDKSTWKHAFCARTGGLNQGHYIDNLIVQYNNYYEYSINGTTWTTTTPIPVPSGTYNVSARYISSPTCVAPLGSVTIDPVTVVASTTLATVCSGQTTVLSATPAIFTGGTHQWESSPAGLGTFTPIAGANTSTYTATVMASVDYRCVIDCGGGASFLSNIVSVTAITPEVATTTAGTRCGLGTVDLSATAAGSGTLDWFAVATGGTAVGTGTTFTTPVINVTTDYYVQATESGCVSPRILVTATVTPPDAINVSPDLTICSGATAQTLTVSSANANYTYVWDPATGLNTTSGSTVSALPVVTTTYNITASDPISGCVTTGAVKISVNQTPVDPIIVPTVDASPCKTVTKLAGTLSSLNTLAQLGTGTLTTSTTAVTPYSSFYEGSREQYIIQASELSALNLVAGPLTSLAFNVTAAGPGTFAQSGFTIKIAQTTDNAFAGAYATPTGSLTTVYGPVTQGAPTVGWNTYTFNTPFNWDGVSNILIDICHDNDISNTCSACYSTSSTVQYTATTFNSVYGRYNDNAQACGVNAASAITTFTTRPNMQIGQSAPANYIWSPVTGLFTDVATSIPYTGGPAENVWARPSVTTTYTVSATGINGCPTSVPDTETAAADGRFVELPGLGTSQVTAVNSCEDFGWTNYYINGKIFFAINWAPSGTLSTQNAAAKNGVTVKEVLDAAIAQCRSNTGNKIYAMKRWWNVTASALSEPVHVRFYYDPTERTDAIAAAGGANPTFNWFKNLTGAYNQATMVTGNNGIANGVTTNLTGTTGIDQGVTYVQFDNVPSFSGGTGAATTQEANLSVSAKVFLANVDPLTGIQDNYIATLGNFPLSDPYASPAFSPNFTAVNSGATATTTPLVLATTGNNAILDWVFLELRQGASGSTNVVQTRAALIQKDGDIVDVDGVSPVAFFGLPSNNYIAIRHRSHTGFRTANLYPLSPTVTTLNFTNNSVPVNGAYPLTNPVGAPTVFVMNAGDSNSDGSIDAFDTITWEIQNGLFDDYNNNADYNLDGSVDAFDTILWELNNGKYQELD